ncbi:SDR family oxidoreductase [Nocardioides sp. GY 10127]|uniref:SDR family NAD(P)-dependent oxidoreductase n=1 Tax=Nocardioides sp. GY 10127 TaxID=2569762 RepID=UPI0010A931C8|nr:SDR family oxidoreductase [Nocardioides sp. GY 10127]TIC80001.1 SDR family oxidoreductase [Nocardioides sp. GY 10127]
MTTAPLTVAERDLAGRSGLVTGAAGGIGRASVLALAARGAHVVVTDVAALADAGEETAALAEKEGGSATFVPADVTVPGDWERVVAAALEPTGTLDFAHNNAGISLAAPFLETGTEDLHRVLEVNLVGVWLGLQHQLPHMLAAGRGSVVNTASLAGLKGLPLGAAYALSKHAVVGLTRSVALEHAQAGVRVNAVCPAAVDTPMTAALPDELRAQIVAPQAIKRFARPSEIGEAVAWLVSDDSSFLTGVALPVDAGATAG